MGILALDIDGTITDASHRIPPAVIDFLQEKIDEGWALILVTGRSFSYARYAIDALPFPYTLICQNGADVLDMPSKKSQLQNYITKDVVRAIDDLMPCIVYSGPATGDFCYYRPECFSEEMQDYFTQLQKVAAAPWIAISSWDEIEQEMFPLAKVIGEKESLEKSNAQLQSIPHIETSVIRDPMCSAYHVIMITKRGVAKGSSLKEIMAQKGLSGPIIGAGDDGNDISLLREADVAIAMAGSPKELELVADIHAPPADKMGIIPAITEAICTL